MKNEVMQEKIKNLWVMANVHVILFEGVALSDSVVDEEGIPEQPSDEDVLTLVVEYLKSLI